MDVQVVPLPYYSQFLPLEHRRDCCSGCTALKGSLKYKAISEIEIRSFFHFFFLFASPECNCKFFTFFPALPSDLQQMNGTEKILLSGKKSFSLFSIMTFIQVGTGDGEDEKLLQLCSIFPRDDSQ